jgi:hypothetical protein
MDKLIINGRRWRKGCNICQVCEGLSTTSFPIRSQRDNSKSSEVLIVTCGIENGLDQSGVVFGCLAFTASRDKDRTRTVKLWYWA